MSHGEGQWVTARSAAVVAGIPERTIRQWVADGKLPAIAGERGRLVNLDQLLVIAETTGRGRQATRQVGGDAADAAGSAVIVAADTAEAISIATVQLDRIEQLAMALGAARAENDALRAEVERLRVQLDRGDGPPATPAMPASTTTSSPITETSTRAKGLLRRLRRS